MIFFKNIGHILTQENKTNKGVEAEPLVQSYQLSGTKYPQKAQVLEPCIPYDVTAPHKRIAIHSVLKFHYHPNLCT